MRYRKININGNYDAIELDQKSRKDSEVSMTIKYISSSIIELLMKNFVKSFVVL
jgi:hypothetical protein